MVWDRAMTITLGKPDVDGLGNVVHVLREWQDDEMPLQLHPGGPGLALGGRRRGDGRSSQDLEPRRADPRHRDVGRSRTVATGDRATS